jgi:beta-lactamase regulating signal transducer with metallopeptidase domain
VEPNGLMVASPWVAPATWLLTYLLHSSVILGGVWLLTRAGPLSRARQRATLWKTGVLAGLVTATVQVAFPSGSPVGPDGEVGRAAAPGSARVIRTARVESRGEAPLWIAPAVPARTWSTACDRAVESTVLEARVRLADPGGGLAAPSTAEVDALVEECGGASADRWSWLLLGLWVAGGLLGGGLLRRRRRRLDRTLHPPRTPNGGVSALIGRIGERAGLPSVRLLEAPGLGTPVALTGRRVVLPSRAVHHLDEDELTAVLAHEVGHLVERDPAWLRLLLVLEALLWMQPLNRVARRAFQDASDFLADGGAVRHTGSRLPLARALEKVSLWSLQGVRPGGVVAMARPESPLIGRVRAILATSDSGSAHTTSPWSVLLLVPALLLPPVQVPRPEIVQVLVVRAVGEASTGAPPSDASALEAGRMELRIYRSSGSRDRADGTYGR